MIHATAEVSPQAVIGPGTRIWHQAQVREGAVIGANCVVGKGVYIDCGVRIGSNVKIQNGAMLYRGLTVADGVFIGPQACFTNDRLPRAVTPEGAPKTDAEWTVGAIHVEEGASIGARVVILPDVTIGAWAMVAAGAVVTRSVPAHALAAGAPARVLGYVCACGQRLAAEGGAWRCPVCGRTYAL